MRVSRPSQAAILLSPLLIFSFRAVGTFRKEKGARYRPVLRPFALLYDVSGVPPIPLYLGTQGPGENSPSPGAAFPLPSSVMRRAPNFEEGAGPEPQALIPAVMTHVCRQPTWSPSAKT